MLNPFEELNFWFQKLECTTQWLSFLPQAGLKGAA
jgi:hypothetical protein